MDVSPKALREVEFREVRGRGGGYHPEDVDHFIEEVAKGVEALQDRLRQAVERAQRAEAAASEASSSDDTLRRTLVLAQRTADLAVQEAREQAARILAGAEHQAQGLLAETEERARRTHEEALGAIRAELASLESTRQRTQSEIDVLTQWTGEHRQHLVGSLREALAALERGGPLSEVPSSTPLDLPRAVPSAAGPPAGRAVTAEAAPATPTATTATGPASAAPAAPTPVAAEAPAADPAPATEVAEPDVGPPTAMWRVAPERAAQERASEQRPDPLTPRIDASRIEAPADSEEQALDDFFEDGEYTDERRFGGRLRRRR